MGFIVDEVVGVVGSLFTDDAGESLLESSPLASLHSFIFFLSTLLLEERLSFLFGDLLVLKGFVLITKFDLSSVVPLLASLSSLLSSSPLSSSVAESEPEEEEEDDDDEDDDEELEEFDEEPEDPECDFLV